MTKAKRRTAKAPNPRPTTPSLQHAAVRGAEAAAKGRSHTACPYPPWNPLHRAWIDGYNGDLPPTTAPKEPD